MKAVKSCGDVFSLSDGINNNGFEVYGSVRDVYEILYNKAIDYGNTKNNVEKENIAKDIDVLGKALLYLSKSSGTAATILEKNGHKRVKIFLVPAAISFLTTLILWLLLL